MVEKFEENLYNFFNEIIYVESNPAVVHTQIIEKIDGKIKSKHIREDYDLHSISICASTRNLFSTECKSPGIIERIKNLCKHIKIDIYNKNIIQKYFYNKSKNLHKVLDNYNNDEYFIITNSDIKNYIPEKFNTFFIDNLDLSNEKRLKDTIIVCKKSKIVLNKNLEKNPDKQDLVKVEFWINSDNYIVIDLF